MSGEHGTVGHAGSSEDKDSPQMSLFEEGSDDRESLLCQGTPLRINGVSGISQSRNSRKNGSNGGSPMVSGVPSDEPVRLVLPDPGWPARFEREREALEEAIGERVCGGIHHVGSTAVSGLEAKPIIDILAGVRDLDAGRACFGPLADLGYLHAPYLPEEMHWFCKPHPARRTHHLHLVPAGSRRYRDELSFRDLLRADPRLAGQYAALKRELAKRHRDDRDAYTEAKSAFIRTALRGEAPSS